MESRPVHFIWILDVSFSMSGEKIGTVNYAIREAIPEMRAVAHDQPSAQLMVRVLTFSATPRWHIATPVPVEQFTWQEVGVDGGTNFGDALKAVARELETPPMPRRALKPVLALVSDGQPLDEDWREGLKAIDATPWGRKAVRVAIAIGGDADRSVLQEFLANPELPVLDANSPKQLAAAIRWASTAAVKAASQPVVSGDSGSGGKQLAPAYAPPQLDDDDDDDVW
ncbi:VWA domain-containing protein [Streptomyces sp. NPDC001351]|uniref:vWA domain-containing protein n=1 Tax=Streptomyces sp. NPDC001351 TaxID=3364564 RepID=UPI0036A14B59